MQILTVSNEATIPLAMLAGVMLFIGAAVEPRLRGVAFLGVIGLVVVVFSSGGVG